MTIDELVLRRWDLRMSKQYSESDAIRDFLDSQLVFCFDHKDYQEVQYLTDSYFKQMAKTGITDKRKYVEFRMKQDRQAEDMFKSWLYTNSQKKRFL